MQRNLSFISIDDFLPVIHVIDLEICKKKQFDKTIMPRLKKEMFQDLKSELSLNINLG